MIISISEAKWSFKNYNYMQTRAVDERIVVGVVPDYSIHSFSYTARYLVGRSTFHSGAKGHHKMSLESHGMQDVFGQVSGAEYKQ